MQAIDNPELPLCWNILTERFSADYILSNLAKYQNINKPIIKSKKLHKKIYTKIHTKTKDDF